MDTVPARLSFEFFLWSGSAATAWVVFGLGLSLAFRAVCDQSIAGASIAATWRAYYIKSEIALFEVGGDLEKREQLRASRE